MLNIHSLCSWKHVIKVIKQNKLYTIEQIKNLENFLYNPVEWRSKF